MDTIELNACRNELARDILATDNIEVLRTVRRAYSRAIKTIKKIDEENCTPYTVDELNARIDEAEAQLTAGQGITSEVAHQRMKRFISNL